LDDIHLEVVVVIADVAVVVEGDHTMKGHTQMVCCKDHKCQFVEQLAAAAAALASKHMEPVDIDDKPAAAAVAVAVAVALAEGIVASVAVPVCLKYPKLPMVKTLFASHKMEFLEEVVEYYDSLEY
jgi:hypothetical protein